MAIIGIDLGTTNSLVCVFRNGKAELIPNALGEYKTSSAVSVLEDGSILVGAAARERLITHPEATAAGFKVWMGTEKSFLLGGRRFKPEELSALVLRQLLQDAQRFLNEPVEEAVISVPAYFNDNQRCATKLAARLAGLTVKRLINEPSAAALYHRHAAPAESCQLMIVDFGGGTLDISVVDCFENIIEITAIAGCNHLGGGDIDRAIAAHFCQENGLEEDRLPPVALAALYRQAETAKIALSSVPEAAIALEWEGRPYSLLLSGPLLRRLCEPIFQQIRTVIRRAMQDRNQIVPIDDVILVGGAAQLPVFGDFLEELFGRRPRTAARTDEIVALGVGLCAGVKARDEALKDLVMTDVCPFSLGVATYNSAQDQNPHMAFLIQRSSMLPASHQGTFYTLHNNQLALRFEIYQGEGYFASENLKLGELEVQVPPGPAGEQYACVTFTYDIDGILHVSARSSGGDCRDRLILNPKLHLTPEEEAQALARVRQLQLASQDRLRTLMERALSLYRQVSGPRRHAVTEQIDFLRSLEDSGPAARSRACSQIQAALDQMEKELREDPLIGNFWTDDLDEE